MDEQTYRRLIERLIRERSGETVLNGSFLHASIINECMFKNAQSSLSVLTRRFSKDVFGSNAFIAAFKESAKQGCSVRILIECIDDDTISSHPLLDAMLEHSGLEVRKLPCHAADEIECNYTIMDDDSYRFEQDKTEAVAVATFGDKEGFAETLNGHFDWAWENSESVNVH